MQKFLCKTCGTQYPASLSPPNKCIICEDERQFVPKFGQEWVTQEEIAVERFNTFRKISPGLYGIRSMPQFAIGQRALLVVTPHGNVLWDCISFIDDATIDIINSLGGLKAIAISHPHFYSGMARWSKAFDCPVYAHEADKEWVVDPHDRLISWSGDEKEILPEITLHRIGGHFPGNTVLHRADNRTLLTGDTMLVTWDRQHVSFMWSYPNYIPLPAKEVTRIGERLDALDYDSMHSAFWGRGDIENNAKDIVKRSIVRHIEGPDVPMDYP